MDSRPIMSQDLEEAHRRMAADESREAEALEWIAVCLNDRLGVPSGEDPAGIE
jgi:hypothetical protein